MQPIFFMQSFETRNNASLPYFPMREKAAGEAPVSKWTLIDPGFSF